MRDLVGFGRFPYSQGRLTKSDMEYVDQAIEYMNLGDLQHKFLDELSGGERQRAFIAMVVAQDTKYVLLDEPLNNLDMKHSVQMMKVLRRLVDELNKTVVLVLHDINFASSYSDDIVAMETAGSWRTARSATSSARTCCTTCTTWNSTFTSSTAAKCVSTFCRSGRPCGERAQPGGGRRDAARILASRHVASGFAAQNPVRL